MSVSKMKKLTLLCHKDEAGRLTERLLRLRCVEIRGAEEGEELGTVRHSCESARKDAEALVSRVHRAAELLNPYAKRARGLFAGKTRVDPDRFRADGSYERAMKAVDEALAIGARKQAIGGRRVEGDAQASAASPYVAFDLPLGYGGTAETVLWLGSLPSGIDQEALGKALFAHHALAEGLKVEQTTLWVAIYAHRDESDAVRELLSTYGFTQATFPGEKRDAKEVVRAWQQERASLGNEEAHLDQKLTALAEELDAIEALYDLSETERIALCEQEKFLATDTTVLLRGWVPEVETPRLERLLDKYLCAYELADPEGEDNPPILLQNNGFARNFEWVLGMYSYPAYGRFDPTFIMSIFYFIIFGIMFADAGYGLVLTLACFLGVRLLKPSRSMERFLKMFGYCGISCMIFGVLFGAYFGDLPLAIMRNMMGMSEAELPNLALMGGTGANLAVLFDPLQNPMGFLIISLAIGGVHLIAGMAVRFVIQCKEGQALDAILDIGLYWLLFLGVGLIFVWQTVGIWMTVLAAVLIVLTHGRGEKNIVMKFLKGLLGLYDLISYVSDLLSYSRILALGLAAGVISQVVNILATMGGATVGGFIGLILAFGVGHLLNIAINVLGTFVHTSRLQYIEFFNKFYEDGGVAFEPALPSEKYTEAPDEESKY